MDTYVQSPGMFATLIVIALMSSTCSGNVDIINPQGPSMSAAVGDMVELVCENDDQTTLEWSRDGMPLISGSHYMIRFEVLFQKGLSRSYLKINEVTIGDDAKFECKNPADYFNKDSVQLIVTEPGKYVRIFNPSTDEIVVNKGEQFMLECEGAEGAKLRWKHNGVPLVDGSISSGARVLISTARRIDERKVFSVMSRQNLDAVHGGFYECVDEWDNYDRIKVRVVTHASDKLPVEITSPTETLIHVDRGESFTLRCRGDASSQLVWYVNGTMIALLTGHFDITVDENPNSGHKVSLLTKENVQRRDTGTYKCLDRNTDDEGDSLLVMVAQNEHQLVSEGPAPTETRSVVLRVTETLTLHCSLEASRDHITEWSKDDQQLSHGSKYSIKQYQPTVLKIHNTERTDAGVYRCLFKQPDSGYITGVVIFNVTVAKCPPLIEPPNGSFHKCPPDPVYGESCHVTCNIGFKSSDERPLVCEGDDTGRTRWNHRVPQCIPLTEEDYLAKIPWSISNVLLRVGEDLKLRCPEGAYWTKHGLRLEAGDKYKMEDHSLIILNAGKDDTGIYDCNVVRKQDGGLIGIKKFNVTTLPCPPLRLNTNGSIMQCSKEPVYGETCVLKCPDGYKLSGSRSRTCELSHNEFTVYWTGNEAVCKNSKFDWYLGGGAAGGSAQQWTVVLLVVLNFSLFYLT